MVAYKLTYFNGRGAGEVIRQILHVAGQEFEDKRITQEEWPALKGSELREVRPIGQETTGACLQRFDFRARKQTGDFRALF